jgi:hypothetical protein
MACPVLTGIAEGPGAAIAGAFARGITGSVCRAPIVHPLISSNGRTRRRPLHASACDIAQAGEATAIEPHADRIGVLTHNEHVLAINSRTTAATAARRVARAGVDPARRCCRMVARAAAARSRHRRHRGCCGV